MGKEIYTLKNKMSARPTVSVYNHANAKEISAEVRMPHVFLAPVREFPVFLDQVPTDLDKPPSVTCAERVEWPILFKHGEDTTERSI